ncbi:MAG: hypothetical protein WCP87_05810 [Atribacterota bacterium]
MFYRSHILIEMSSDSVVLGSAQIRERFQREIERLGLTQEVKILDTGTFGAGIPSPFVVIYPDNIVYAPVRVDQVKTIVEEHLWKGRPVRSLMFTPKQGRETQSFLPHFPLAKEKRVVLRNSGHINPAEIEDYIAQDGYLALGMVLSQPAV